MDATHLGTRFHVRHLGETMSTNAVALAAAGEGEPEGLVVVADVQTAGRGRLGRAWVAPAGSALLMSVLLRPSVAPHLMVSAVGCAAAAGCGEVAGVQPGLKWPNDLVVGSRKLGGILAEATATAGSVTALVVGLGLNLRSVDRPPEIQATATDLESCGGVVIEPDVLLGRLLDELEIRLQRSPAQVLDEYRARCVTIGMHVRVEQPSGALEGRAVGVGDDGALELETGPGSRVRVDIGDVIHLRPV